MDKKKPILLVFGLVLIIALIFLIWRDNAQNKIAPLETENKVIDQNNILSSENGEFDSFKTAVPANIKVPEVNEIIPAAQKEEIAVPSNVVAAAPGVESKIRNFEIQAENNKFTPSTIIVNQGDTVNIRFSAIDKDYDIVFPSYNMRQSAKKGQLKILAFQALETGSFTYYCEICGGIDSGAKGQIIIK